MRPLDTPVCAPATGCAGESATLMTYASGPYSTAVTLEAAEGDLERSPVALEGDDAFRPVSRPCCGRTVLMDAGEDALVGVPEGPCPLCIDTILAGAFGKRPSSDMYCSAALGTGAVGVRTS